MEKPIITKECVKPVVETKFVSVYDLQYAPGKHYYDATRRGADQLMACKGEEAFREALPDAVSCFVIIEQSGREPVLLLDYEFRYPTGQFILSVPAGLLDPEDACTENPIVATAIREIYEETGLSIREGDRVEVVNPLAFSTPGMSDESNALVCAVVHPEDLTELNQSGAVGTECFDGFHLVNKEEALKLLQSGRDEFGNFYSMFTWGALLYFVSGLWKK